MDSAHSASQEPSAMTSNGHGNDHAGPSQHQQSQSIVPPVSAHQLMSASTATGSPTSDYRPDPRTPVAIDPYSRNLGRGKACEACRRRKLRCDGERPTCGRCIEARTRKLNALRRKGHSEEELRNIVFPPCSANREGEDEGDQSRNGNGALLERPGQSPETPSYDDRNNIFAAGAQGSASSAADATQAAANRASSTSQGEPGKRRRVQRALATGPSRLDADIPLQNDLFFAEILSSHLPLESSTRGNGQHISSSEVPKTIAFVPYRGQGETPPKEPTPTAQAEASTSLTVSYALAEPDVPLPPADKLEKLVNVSFEELHVTSIFHPGRLRERLALDEDHVDYPHPCALHILAAVAYAARPELDEGPSAPTTRSGAHYRHTMAARHHITTCIHMGTQDRPLDVVRTALLLVFKLYGMGDQMESYLATSTAVRLAISLNANRELPGRSDSADQFQQFTLLQPRIADASTMQIVPRDEIEAEEVRRTMLLVFVVDRISIAATLWPGSISEEDYTAELPRATVQEFLSTTTDNLESQPWTARRNMLSLQSSDFFSRPASDPEQFMYKGSVLLGRCALYVSRLPRSATPDYITSSSRFQQLESCIAALHLESSEMAKAAAAVRGASGGGHANGAPGYSPSAQPAKKAEGSLAAYLLASSGEATVYKGLIIGSSLMPYACTLTLHEPLANLTNESEAMCRAATRGIIGILRLCAVHAETEMTRLDVSLTLIVMLAGRSLIRQLESLYSKYIAQEIAQQSTKSETDTSPNDKRDVWSCDEFTDSVSLLQADLEVAMLTLKRFGQKWFMATKLHDALLKLLQFNPEHRLRGLFCVE